MQWEDWMIISCTVNLVGNQLEVKGNNDIGPMLIMRRRHYGDSTPPIDTSIL